VVTASGRHFQGVAGGNLAYHISQVRAGRIWKRRTAGRFAQPSALGGLCDGRPQQPRQLIKAFNPYRIRSFDQARLRQAGGWHHYPPPIGRYRCHDGR
jgi:hypothetical protein